MGVERAEYGRKLEECIQYFRQRSVYDKLFLKVRDKYRSLGHFGGTVQLSGLAPEERRQLGGFFQKDFVGKETVSISAAAMEKALDKSRFSGLTWEAVLQGYFQEELVGKKEQRLQEDAQKERFFERLIAAAPAGPGRIWLEEVFWTRGEGYLLLMKQYRERPQKLEENISLLMQAIPRLPLLTAGEGEVSCELIAVFAAETTGDPHFFDTGTLGEQLLTVFLKEYVADSFDAADFKAREMIEVSGEERTTRTSSAREKAGTSGSEERGGFFRIEEKAELLYKAGLLRDELSNNALVYGINGVSRDGELHEGISGFLKRKEPLQMTLMTMRKLAQVLPQQGKYVYIVENPAVFTKLMKAWPEAAIICGNGQIRLATLVLLDLFSQETHFLYAGDYDPEGLQIAQRLKERYRERLQLWKYHREFYEKYQSDVKISEKSLKKLEHIYLQELQEVKLVMLQQKKAAYQEAMLEEYLRG